MAKSPKLIAVGGGTCSGKSVLCDGIRASLGDRCTHVAYDNYYHSLTPSQLADVPSYNFDEPQSLDTPRLIEDLTRLKRGETVNGPSYDFSTHLRTEAPHPLLPRDIILVEGILTLCDASLRALFDLSIFVETPGDLRLSRRIRRDVQDRGRTEASVRDQWERTVAPMHDRWVKPSAQYADYTLDGSRNPQAVLDEALRLIARVSS